MDWNAVPTTEPDIIFPIGAVIEDCKGKYKILRFEKQGILHKYKVEVLEQKIPIPNECKVFMDPKIQGLLVLPQNLHGIKRIE